MTIFRPIAPSPRVSKSYNDGSTEVNALQGVNLSVDAGSLVAVMGPSGSGKSTLLTVAGSLEDPTEGALPCGGAKSREPRNATRNATLRQSCWLADRGLCRAQKDT